MWNNIKQWCNNKNNPKYKYYGEKGISICKQWESSFETFLNDVGNKPKNSIFCRKNEFDNFTKENCYKTVAKTHGSCPWDESHLSFSLTKA